MNSRNWFIAGVAAVCFVTGIALSHLIEPGVRVEKVTFAKDTPALKFIPTDAGPHPVSVAAMIKMVAIGKRRFVIIINLVIPSTRATQLGWLSMRAAR